MYVTKPQITEIIKAPPIAPLIPYFPKIFGLEKRGELKKGYFADICVVDDNKSYTIRAKNFKSKAKYSPFEGKNVFGVVKSVIIEGKIKFGG